MTMQVIQHIELTSNATGITFSSIPNGYTDLLIAASLRSNRTDNNVSQIAVSANGSTANFSFRNLFGRGSTVSSGTQSALGFASTNMAVANVFGNIEIYISNYTSSTAKSISATGVTEDNATQAFQSIVAGLWNNNSALIQLTLIPAEATEFVIGSSATLYGITKGSDGTTTVS